MTVKNDIKETIKVLKKLRKFKSQEDVAESLGYNASYFSRTLGGNDIPIEFEEKFFKAFPRSVYLYSKEEKINKQDEAIEQLNKIKSKKSEDKNENKVVSKDEIINIKTYIIPIKGFANLKTAFYSDEYISQNFEETTTEVPKHLYSPISYKIQSSGKSMPDSIPEDAWVTGVPVDEMLWQNYKFLENKIYILFHWDKGIFFKYVKNLSPNKIELSSQNPDKQNYGSETFNLGDFRKILLAIKVETFI